MLPNEYCLVGSARLDTDSPQYATMRDDRLIFPTGRFPAQLTTPDLVAARTQGHLVDVDHLGVYHKAPIFRSFVTELYELRLQAKRRKDEVSSWLIRVLLNSLYGKFGQRGITWRVMGPAPDDRIRRWVEVDLVEGIRYDMRTFAGILQQKEELPESANSHPAIAAHVTAYARRYLWELMVTAGRSNVFYCDTDSLYVNARGSKRLASRVDPHKLGALKLEGASDWLDIHGPKDYATPEKSKTKGVRSKATWIGPDMVEQEQWASLVGLIGQGQLDTPTTTMIRKTLRREYTKGTVLSSGRVVPFHLKGW